jgi:hypothetical protein
MGYKRGTGSRLERSVGKIISLASISMRSAYHTQSSYIPFILPPWTLLLVKATFFILYLSIFGSLRWVRLVCWIGLSCISIVHVAIGSYSVAIAVIASTKPYDMHSWELRAIQIGVAASIPGLVVDTTLLVIPIIAIAPLQLSRAKKIGALLIFLTGVL